MSVRIANDITTEYDSNDSAVLKISIRVRRKTRAEWLDEARIGKIPEGEACYATDTGELKIGRSVSGELQYWKDLPNVLGVNNEIKLNTTTGNRYLCIDDGDLDQ